jgi:curved DNA-binding protein CbpA
MKDQTLATLIDQYLMGTISPQDKANLEQLMATDPSVAELFKENQLAFNAIQLEQNRRLKDKLRALDKDDLTRQGFFSSRSGKLTFVLVTLFIFYYMASAYYSVESIAGRNLERYITSDDSAKDLSETEMAWKEAEGAFLMKEYPTALLRYKSLAEIQENESSQIIRWNILMTRLALEGSTPSWKQDLETFARETSGDLGTKASRLSRFLGTVYGRFFTKSFQENFSSIKPRLI